jgi:hypothetical protein
MLAGPQVCFLGIAPDVSNASGEVLLVSHEPVEENMHMVWHDNE